MNVRPHTFLSLQNPISIGNNLSYPGGLINWSVVHDNSLGAFNIAQPDRLVIPETGVYQLGSSHHWDFNVNGMRQIYFMVNGNNVVGKISDARPGGFSNGSSVSGTNISAPLALNQGDVIQFYAYQTSGGNLGFKSTNFCWIAPFSM